MIEALLVATDDVEEARRKLGEAIDQAARERGKVGQNVDKYFGTKLPPVCERLGCYLTDDGKRFYCVNPGCQKHRKRATKHSKVRHKSEGPVYFRCPACGSRRVENRLGRMNVCKDCGHEWPVNP